ncbi:MAG: hypothetical protein JHD20_03130 [Gemmataceae bacterium]|nr:hypothetical protein [Gemmataceae bacterium]
MMLNLRSKIAFSTLAFLALGQNPASAAWNNVYQVSCNNTNATASTSNYQPAPTPCNLPGCTQQICQQQNCATRYVQKFYYEPVTSYESTSYYEPVTSYKTSYYYEPVTSYKTSYYYDPSQCGYQQMATPVTSYQLKAQNCPVNSYMLRTALKPVTSYKQSYYYEPQTTCCNTSVGVPVMPQIAAPCTTPLAPVPNPNIAPGVNEQRATPTPAPAAVAPGINENRELAPNPTNSSRSSVIPGKTVSPVMPAPQVPSSVRLDRIVSLKSASNLQGSVVTANQLPATNAKLFLVHETVRGLKVNVTTDANGMFSTTVEPGNWLVYLADVDGRAVFQKQIEVKSSELQTMKLVSR